MKVGIWLWIATCKYIMLICLNTIKQYIFPLPKSLPTLTTQTHTSEHIHTHTYFSRQTQKRNHVVFGKEK